MTFCFESFLANEKDDERITDDNEVRKEILMAIEDDNISKLGRLLSKAHLSAPMNILNQTIIHLAVMFATPELIKILMDYVDKTADKTTSGMTPLHCASQVVHGCVQNCIEKWPENLNSFCSKKMSPLMYALENSLYHTAIGLIMETNTDISLRDENGNNMLFYLAEFPKLRAINLFKCLLKKLKKEMLTGVNKNGCSAIQFFANKDLIKMLFVAGKGIYKDFFCAC